MKTKLLSLFVAVVATTTLLASNVISYEAVEKLPETEGSYTSVGLHLHAFNVAITSHEFSNGIGTITFDGEVTTIEGYAFYKCNFISLSIPNSIKTIKSGAFYLCQIENVNYLGSIFDWCLIKFDDATANPNIFGYHFLLNGEEITDLMIPDAITTIGNFAFYGCKSIISITIPESVNQIGYLAFGQVNNIVYSGTATGTPWGAKCVNGYVDGYLVYSDATKTTLCGCIANISGKATIPNSVTTIGVGAFSDCYKLTSLEIPNSVITIGASAFSNCTSLSSIMIGDSVKTIGRYAFLDCISLLSVIIPHSVTTIEPQAFSGCKGLTFVSIGDSVKKIEPETFFNCSKILSITIGKSITTIGTDAFYNCYSLNKTNYTGSIEDWCKITFNTLNSNPISKSKNFFINDIEITDLVIPDNVEYINAYAFANCTSLSSVTIPNSVITIGNQAFENIANINYTGTATGSPWGAKCINGYVDGYFVYSDVSKTTLCGCSSAATGDVIIPNSVVIIRERTFLQCNNISSITIPVSVKLIESRAFESCVNLKKTNYTGSIVEWCKINFKDNPISFSHNFYINNVEIKDLIIPIGVDSICANAFRSCTGLTSVSIPNSVTTIGNGVFKDCTNLTSVTIGNSVTTIGDYVFNNCKGLTSITIPNSVITIGYTAFNGCSGLTSITIGNSVTTIGGGAFGRCAGLTSITIPNSVTTIGDNAFANCSNLVSITLGNSIISLGNDLFEGCTSLPIIDNIRYADTYLVETVEKTLSSYDIKDGTKWIGNLAFCNCRNLTSISFPNSVIEIGEYAFSGCQNLISIPIPKSIVKIGKNAFHFCDKLTTIHWDAKNCDIPQYDKSAAYDGTRDMIFHGSEKNITQFILGNNVEVIPAYLCYGLTNIKEMVVPFSVRTIGSGAFNNVKTITIPNTINSLGNEWLGGSYSSKEKTIYVVFSPFEYNNNPESLDDINPIIKNASYQATLIPQCANVATYKASPTTIEMDIDLTNIPTTHLYDSISIDYFGEENDIENILTPSTQNHVIFTGLTPNQKANIYYTSKKIGEDDWEEGAKLEIQLPKLNFTTLVPKVVSAGTAVVAAETNISDYETNVGFEWRKYDAPESMPSKSGAAILYNGMMEGKLLNLGTDAYWNVRPYYEAADGTRYYGEWITFDPSDFSYFEPTVHTYALATSPTANKVQVRGYVMTGTDDVTEQGFEYWFKGGQKAPHRAPNATADSVYRVTASGQVMTAVLEDLAYSSTYTCRAYAIAGGKTYYGEEVQFLTPEDPRPIYTLTVIAGENGSVNTEVSGQYREGEQVTLTATPNVGYLFEQWSDGNTENPYILTIMQDTEITATFKQAESGLTNLHNNIRATKYFHNGNLIIERNGIKYTPTGQKVR